MSDFDFVGNQLLKLGHNPPVTLYPGMSARAIYRLTKNGAAPTRIPAGALTNGNGNGDAAKAPQPASATKLNNVKPHPA